MWISYFTDWTFCVFGASGLIGFLVTLGRMAQRAKSRKLVRMQPDAEAGHGASRSNGVHGLNGMNGSAAAAQGAEAPLPPSANGSIAAPHAVGSYGGLPGINSTTALARKVTSMDSTSAWSMLWQMQYFRHVCGTYESEFELSPCKCSAQWTWYEAIYLLVFETSAACELFLTVSSSQQQVHCGE